MSEDDYDEQYCSKCYGEPGYCDCEEDDEVEVHIGESKPDIEFRIRQKIIDLQDQLLKHYQKQIELNDVDQVRYTAMVEVLKAVLQ